MEARDVVILDEDLIPGIATEGKTVFHEVKNELVSIVEVKRQIGHGSPDSTREPCWGFAMCSHK